MDGRRLHPGAGRLPSGLALALGPILGGALVDAFSWRAVFWINVPITVAAIVCTALFVPESRAPRARRFDPVGQLLVVLALGGVVYAIIEAGRLGWTSPVILASAFLFATTLYLQAVRGLSALSAGLCLLPVGVLVILLSPRAGRLVAARGPRLPLVISGTALALGGLASVWIGPATPLAAVIASFALFGVFLGMVNPPITNTAVSGMPRSMAGVATSLASSGRSHDRPGEDRGAGTAPQSSTPAGAGEGRAAR